MFSKSILMCCGHNANALMKDIPYSHESDLKVDLAVCDFCFDQLGTAAQPACTMDTISEKFEPLPKIKRNLALPILGAAICAIIIITMIVSL